MAKARVAEKSPVPRLRPAPACQVDKVLGGEEGRSLGRLLPVIVWHGEGRVLKPQRVVV